MDSTVFVDESNEDTAVFFRRLFKRLRKHWWIVASTFFLAGIVAFLFIRYQPKIYSIGAMVIIEPSSGGLDATGLLFGEEFASGSKDVINELIILKSYPIIEKTVLDVSQHLQYFRTTQALQRVIEINNWESPFIVDVDKNDSLGKYAVQSYEEPIRVTLREESFDLLVDDGKVILQGQPWNEPFKLGDVPLILRKNDRSGPIDDDVTYMFYAGSLAGVTNDYKNRLQVTLIDDRSSIISLGLSGPLIDREERFMRTLLRNYLRADLNAKNEGASNTIKFINSELDIITDSLKKIEGRLEVFKSRNKISNLQSDGQRIFERLFELEEERAVYQLRQKYLDLISEYLNDKDRTKLVAPSAFGIEDASLSTLMERLTNLETERNLLKSAGNSQINAELTSRINELRNNLESYIKSIAESNNIQLSDLNNRIRMVEVAVQGLPVSEMALMNIERLHKLSESLYLLLLEKRAEAEITKSSNTPDIKVVEPPRLLSSSPVKPNKRFIYSIFLILGLLIPVGILGLLVYLDDTVRTRDEVTRKLNIPYLGEIDSAKGKSQHYIVKHPKSRLSESFRSIRSNMKYMSALEGDMKVILVTSCFPGEGKTFVSANLGLSMFSAGKKVIVIGADLRKPELQNQFGLKNDIGLSTYLASDIALEQVIQTAPIGIDVMVSGPIPPNPLELLDSTKFADLIQVLKERYDFVVIDTSPFMLVSDSKTLFPKSDFNLIVLRSGKSKRANLKLVQELLDENQDCRFGLALNDHQRSEEYGYRYGYGGGEGYYQEQE